MIKKVEITGIQLKVGDDLKKYARRKIGRLDKYIPRAARPSAHVEVKLKEETNKGKHQCTCEVIMQLPSEVITTHETTLNIFAAVDIVEAKLKNQLKKYKETHATPKLHRRLLARLRGKS